MDLFYAQQARSVLDLLIGFKISPLLWSNIQPKLSAGRCQSPALKLVYERHKLIKDFVSNKLFEIKAPFSLKLTNDDTRLVNTQYSKDIEDEEKAKNKIDLLVNYVILLNSIK